MKSLFLFFFFSLAADNYKLYCFYTPDFKPLYEEYFLPSIKDDFEIIAKEYPQECPSGAFKSDGWGTTMLRKLEMLQEAVLEHWGDRIFFYSDIDIIFFKPIIPTILNHLKERDLVAQQGWPGRQLCAGFLVMKGNEATLKLITRAIQLLQNGGAKEDQTALRKILALYPEEIKWALLPSEQFPNGKRVLKSPRSNIELDRSILLFHANCCIGLEQKYEFLNRVIQQYSRMQADENNLHDRDFLNDPSSSRRDPQCGNASLSSNKVLPGPL
jgi:hypothetical protein